jgi:hypothetical protein
MAIGDIAGELAGRLAALTGDDVPDDVAVAARPSPSRWRASTPWVVGTGGALHDPADQLVVGRAGKGNAVDVPVESPLVSRRHVLVWADGDALLCRDLGSKNGTVRVRDGVRCAVGTVQATLLEAGDALVTASDTTLVTVPDTYG